MSSKKEKPIKKKEKKEKEDAAPAPVESETPKTEEKTEEKKEENKEEPTAKKEEPVAKKEEPAAKKEEPKRAQRATSNVFALFNQSQIQEFKEAFTMIDQNRDGIIDTNDLAVIYQNIGRDPDPKVLTEMVEEAPGPLNFTMFLGLFGDKLKGTDPESTLRDAFIMFDEDGKGKLHEEYVKDLLMNVGDQFSRDEIKQVWKEAPIESGMLDYLKFVQIIKRGKDDE